MLISLKKKKEVLLTQSFEGSVLQYISLLQKCGNSKSMHDYISIMRQISNNPENTMDRNGFYEQRALTQ